MVENTGVPRMTVVGSRPALPSAAHRVVRDGAAWSGLGGVVAGGFGVEAAKSVLTGEAAGRWWFVLCCAIGLALMGIGACLRVRAEARVPIGIVVTAAEPGRGLARAEQREQQATAYSEHACAVTVKTSLTLPASRPWSTDAVDALADETVAAATIAERLVSGASRINLIPTMPLPVGFRFGARLGHTHARGLLVHALRQGAGTPAYFPATTLTDGAGPAVEHLIEEPVEVIDGGDPSRTALAIDLQNRGAGFTEPVRATCRTHGIGNLIVLRRRAPGLLDENDATFTAIVEQVCRAWRTAPLPAAARTGRHAAFLSGPLAIAIALGARLANVQPDRWTAFTYDNASSSYEPFPA